MRIAVWHNLPSGGGKRALNDHLRGLVARGHELEVWCPSTADTDYLPTKAVAPEHVLPLQVRRLPEVRRRLLLYAMANPQLLERIDAMQAHARQFAEVVNRGGFDIVLANSCRWFFTPFAGRHLRIPSTLYLQEPCRWLYEASPRLPWLAEQEASQPWWHPAAVRRWVGGSARVHPIRVLAREEATNARAFDRVLVNSRFSRESVLRALGVDAKVCYLGIDTARFRPSQDERDTFVLSVGEFAPHKNPSFVVRAIGASRRKPVLVWVANRVDDAYLSDTMRLAADLGVTIELKTRVSEDELVGFYQRAAVFLYAPHLEPFGLAPLEAGACGTPTIAVAEGGVRETVAHMETGIVVDSEPEQMGAAIDLLMDNPDKARQLGENGAALVLKQWTLDAAVERLEQHLDAVRQTGVRPAHVPSNGSAGRG